MVFVSKVPEFSRKACTFMISSDSYGVFNIVAKMAGLEVEQMTLEVLNERKVCLLLLTCFQVGRSVGETLQLD